jgi:isopentenyl-diphosphate delta-isomerase
MKSRESRKLDHIKYAMHIDDGPCASGFSDVHLLHNCLPGIDRNQVDLSVTLPGIGELQHPIIINAITGGASSVKEINQKLAETAAITHCAMAVGSQYGSVREGKNADTFTIVRKINPNGKIFANLSAFASVEDAKRAVEMIGACALQIHLNAAQELAMEEGDRDFTSCLQHIEAICRHAGVPVIVKETGCGMAKEQAKQLLDCGVSLLDVGGAGGTNFPAIEHCRYQDGNAELNTWGIPTVLSLREVVSQTGWQGGVIASGGIRSGLDVVKSQVLGANAAAMAGNVLRIVLKQGVEAAADMILRDLEAIKDFYVLLGCRKASELRKVRFYLTGDTADAIRSLEIL